MPFYAYRCTSCGFEKDHLQKMNAPVLSVCPQCGQSTYQKQVTAAGFQLKGKGWYATDFKTTPPGASAPQKPESPPAACQACPGANVCAASS